MKSMILLFLIFPFFANAQLEIHSDSNIEGPPYAEIVAEMEEMADQSAWVQLVNIGQTVRGVDTYGILVHAPNTPITKLVTASGATHGNEYVGIVHKLVRQFLTTPTPAYTKYFREGGAVFVLPILNPDGYAADRRHNANGIDLNRDFPLSPLKMKGLSQPETKNYVGYIDELITVTGASYEVAMDYHCCYGGLLYPFSYTKSRIPKEDLDAHIEIALLMIDQFPKYKHGITGELLGYYPKGTSKDFWYLQYGARAYTFEGQRTTEVNKLQQHVMWWSYILESI